LRLTCTCSALQVQVLAQGNHKMLVRLNARLRICQKVQSWKPPDQSDKYTQPGL